jgi:hypothetical protein
MAGIIAYIALSELLFYFWRTWWLIADIVIVLLVLYAVSLTLIHMRSICLEIGKN